MATGQLIFKPLEFNWQVENQYEAFQQWKGQVSLPLDASNIKKKIWYATMIGFLGAEGYKWWTNLKNAENKKNPEKVKYSIVQIIGKLGRFMTFFFFALLEWLPTLTNGKYMGLFRLFLSPLKIEKRSNMTIHHLDGTGIPY